MSCAGMMVFLSIFKRPVFSAISRLFLIERPSVTIFFPSFSEVSPGLYLARRRRSIVVIELQVAGNNDVALRRFYRDTHRVGNRVGNGEELHFGGADGN